MAAGKHSSLSPQMPAPADYRSPIQPAPPASTPPLRTNKLALRTCNVSDLPARGGAAIARRRQLTNPAYSCKQTHKRKPGGGSGFARSARVGGAAIARRRQRLKAQRVGVSWPQNTPRPRARLGGPHAGARTKPEAPPGVRSPKRSHKQFTSAAISCTTHPARRPLANTHLANPTRSHQLHNLNPHHPEQTTPKPYR
jgi:hypothetical protein